MHILSGGIMVLYLSFFGIFSIGFLKPVSGIRWIKELFGRFVILQFCEYKPSLINPET